MGHPSEYYVRFLLAESWGDEDKALEVEGLNEALKEYGLLEITDTEFERIRDDFTPPNGFRFAGKRHTPTANFMRDEKISSLWKPDKDMTRVLKELLGQNLVTDVIHILLMGDVPSKVVAELVSKRFRISPSLTPKMIDYYRHYYWRRDAYNYHQWEVALRHRNDADRYLAPLYGGDQQALFRAGFNPKYDYKRALRDSHRQVSFRIQYLASKPDDKHFIDLLVKLSREERALYERLWGEGGGLADQAKAVRTFLMKHKIPNVKKLDEFIGEHGSISGDGTDDDDEAESDVDEETEE